MLPLIGHVYGNHSINGCLVLRLCIDDLSCGCMLVVVIIYTVCGSRWYLMNEDSTSIVMIYYWLVVM